MCSAAGVLPALSKCKLIFWQNTTRVRRGSGRQCSGKCAVLQVLFPCRQTSFLYFAVILLFSSSLSLIFPRSTKHLVLSQIFHTFSVSIIYIKLVSCSLHWFLVQLRKRRQQQRGRLHCNFVVSSEYMSLSSDIII